MLTQTQRELISAAVDGDLSAAERKDAKRLISESAEAKALFLKLRRQADSLKHLPAKATPFDFSGDIVGLIRERGLKPIPLPPQRIGSGRSSLWNPPFWALISSAAAVLMTITLGSYVFFTDDSGPKKSSEIAKKSTPKIDAPIEVAQAESGRLEVGPVPREIASEVVQAPTMHEVLPSPRVVEDDTVLTVPVPNLPTELFDIGKVRLSLILPLRELDQAYPKQKLRTELARDQFVRLDVFCRDLPRSLDQLQQTLRGTGHEIGIDSYLTDRLKKKGPVEVVMYTESLGIEEIALLLEQLAAEDRKLEQKKIGSSLFDTFVLAPFLKSDLDRLAKLMGVSAGVIKPESKSTTLDLTRPISDGTGNQLVQNLGKIANPSASPKSDKLSVLLSYAPANPSPAGSKEIKSYLEKRGPIKSGNKPLMLVLRSVN